MSRITLSVNGQTVTAEVPSRMHLADFLREERLLTGTHLGCEHGVCGACPVLLDGAPARSCIAFTAACDGADVRTIEGLEDDPVIARLRAAFTATHALQCGYCTPGMLVTARDIVQRLPDADEARIRLELAGNLCRCTGYAGIVRAIQRVLAEGAPVQRPAPEPLPALPALPRQRPFVAPNTPDRSGITQTLRVAFGVGCHQRSLSGCCMRSRRATDRSGGRSFARRGTCLARTHRHSVQRRRAHQLR
jgi:aerobic carbon-monoxide dehydrogenase small subunit